MIKWIKKILLCGLIAMQSAWPLLRYAFNRHAVALGRVKFVRRQSQCIVLGNGPSLKKDMPIILQQAKECDVFAVNHFAESEYFTQIKPIHYVLLDTYFWADDAHPIWQEKRAILFAALKQVNWPMALYVLDDHYHAVAFLQAQINNPMVSIISYKAIPMHRVEWGCAAFSYLYRTHVFTPPACNVLIYGVYLAVLAGYKQVVCYGADLSFHMDVQVNQSNNQTYIQYRHFYKEETTVEPLLKNPHKTEPFTMYELLNLTALTYFAHASLLRWAQYQQVQIENASSFSLLDVYPRRIASLDA